MLQFIIHCALCARNKGQRLGRNGPEILTINGDESMRHGYSRRIFSVVVSSFDQISKQTGNLVRKNRTCSK